MGCHALPQGIFPTQGSNTNLLHCRQILYRLSHGGPELYIRAKMGENGTQEEEGCPGTGCWSQRCLRWGYWGGAEEACQGLHAWRGGSSGLIQRPEPQREEAGVLGRHRSPSVRPQAGWGGRLHRGSQNWVPESRWGEKCVHIGGVTLWYT